MAWRQDLAGNVARRSAPPALTGSMPDRGAPAIALALQRAAGNQAVTGLLQRAFTVEGRALTEQEEIRRIATVLRDIDGALAEQFRQAAIQREPVVDLRTWLAERVDVRRGGGLTADQLYAAATAAVPASPAERKEAVPTERNEAAPAERKEPVPPERGEAPAPPESREASMQFELSVLYRVSDDHPKDLKSNFGVTPPIFAAVFPAGEDAAGIKATLQGFSQQSMRAWLYRFPARGAPKPGQVIPAHRLKGVRGGQEVTFDADVDLATVEVKVGSQWKKVKEFQTTSKQP